MGYTANPGKGTPDRGGSSSGGGGSSGRSGGSIPGGTDRDEYNAGHSVTDRITGGGGGSTPSSRSPGRGGGSPSSRPGQPDLPGEATATMIRAGVMTPAGKMKDIIGYYQDPNTGAYKFAARGEPINTFSKPSKTATPLISPQFIAEQTAAYAAEKHTERVRSFVERYQSPQQIFATFMGTHQTIQQKPSTPTIETPSLTTKITTKLWGEEVSKQIAEREARKERQREHARKEVFGAVFSIKPGLEKVLSPLTTRIGAVTAPWYEKQKKKIGLGGEPEAREIQRLSDEYQRALSGEDRRSITEIKDIERKLIEAQTKYEAARGTPPITLTEAQKQKTWAYKSHQVAQEIRGLDMPKVTGITPIAKLVREGAAEIVEGFGSTPTAVKYAAPVLAKEPALVVPLAAVGITEFGKSAYHHPAQTATTMAMTYGLFKGVGKVTRPITPTIIEGEGYRGVGIKGFEEPIPLAGIRTESGIATPEGITSTYRGLVVGKQWTPVEYYKASQVTVTPTPKETMFEAQHGTQLRIGQLRYEKQSIAHGKMEGGYFLPKGETPITPVSPELTTAEKGVIPVEPIKFPLSTDVVTPKPLKPTRFYMKIQKPFVKGGDVSMFGSKAKLRWTEIGQRQLTYGVEGAPKQFKAVLGAERWGYHPTYPAGLAAGNAPATAHILGYTPKQIPPDMYFETTSSTSRFYDLAHKMRRVAAPKKPSSGAMPKGGYADVSVPGRGRQVHAQAITAPAKEPMPFTQQQKVFGTDVFDMQPQPQKATPVAAARPAPTFAEPPEPAQALKNIFQRMHVSTHKAAAKTTPKSTLAGVFGAVHPAAANMHKTALYNMFSAKPIPAEKAAAHTDTVTTTKTISPVIESFTSRHKTTPVTSTTQAVQEKTIATLTGGAGGGWGGTGVAVTMPPPPPPPLMGIPSPDKKKKRKRKTYKQRGAFRWTVKNPLRDFFGTPAEQSSEIQGILGIPARPQRRSKK